MPQTTVLIGFAEAMAAPEVTWSLADAGFRVVAFARRGKASALRHSRYVESHEVTAPESDINASLSELSALMSLLESQAAGAQLVLFPLDDKAVWLCSKIELNSSWLLAGPQGTRADLALNKYLQVEAARNAGFNVPQSALIRTAHDLFAFCAEASYPIILKQNECVPIVEGRVFSCRKWICANRAELERAIAEWKERVPLLAQSFITGVGEGVFGLADPEGVRAWSGHRRVRMMNPQGSGSSACISQPVSQEVKQNAETLITQTGWSGLFMIELLRDESGKIWFVELNGRPWGSMALCRRQGLEYPAWHVNLALDKHSKAGNVKSLDSRIICRHAGREFMHVLFVLRGARSNALNRWPSFWKTIADVLHFRREDGLYNWRSNDKKVFWADFYYTIHDNVFKSRN
jgi:predicted ATP-grasp superfamily ATP-dependent carboligase